MKSINIGVLLCLITIAVASFFVFLQNVKVTATELKRRTNCKCFGS